MKRRNPLKHSLVVIGVLFGFLISSMAYGDSSVIVQNNTTHPLVLKTTSTLGSQYWKNKSTYIPPGGRAEIYETNRDKGVKDGKT